MANTRQDRRVQRIAVGIICIGAIFGAVAFLAWGIEGLLIAFGVTFLLFLWLTGWLIWFYNCPACARELHSNEPESFSAFAIRHYCPKCGVTWEAGIEINLGIGE